MKKNESRPIIISKQLKGWIMQKENEKDVLVIIVWR